LRTIQNFASQNFGIYEFSSASLRACAVSAGLPARNAYGIAVAGGRPRFYRKKI